MLPTRPAIRPEILVKLDLQRVMYSHGQWLDFENFNDDIGSKTPGKTNWGDSVLRLTADATALIGNYTSTGRGGIFIPRTQTLTPSQIAAGLVPTSSTPIPGGFGDALSQVVHGNRHPSLIDGPGHTQRIFHMSSGDKPAGEFLSDRRPLGQPTQAAALRQREE